MIESKLEILFLSVLLLFSACNSDEEQITMEEEKEELERQFREIETLAKTAKCLDSANWSHVQFGSRACGGPQGYIPYYLQTDTALLFAQLNSYAANEQAYNERWGISSICTVPNEPSGVKCENENPILIYD